MKSEADGGHSYRSLISACLAGIGCLLLIAGTATVYLNRVILDPDRFADRAVTALDDPAVRDAAGELIAEAIVQNVNSDLIAFQAVIQATASGIANTQAFQSALRAGIVQAYDLALGRGDDSVVVTAANVGVLARSALAQLSPGLASQIPAGLSPEMADLSQTSFGLDLAQIADDFDAAAVVLPLLALIMFAAAIGIETNRRRGVVRCGIGVAAAGLGVVVLTVVAGRVVAGQADDAVGTDAVGAIWGALFSDLISWGLALSIIGVFVTGVAAALLRPGSSIDWVRAGIDSLARQPDAAWLRILRAVALLVLGIVMVAEPGWAARALVVLIGLAVLHSGAAELVRMTLPDTPVETEGSASARVPLRTTAVVTVAGLLLVLVVGFAVAGVTGDSEAEPADGPITACNGKSELCDRPLDQVAFAGTHNSMSAAGYRGFLFPMQDRTIPGQLDDGIHALLIDAYYGFPGRVVYTDFDRSPSKLLAMARDQFGDEFVDAANSIRSQIARPQAGAESELYLCHGFCELGAIDLVDTFRRIDVWLDANPHEVLIIVIEDYVDPADIEAAVVESGLIDHVYKGPDGPPWPTLREMIETDGQVMIAAENDSGDVSWYRQAFDLFQETPFEYASAAEMRDNCETNRGESGNSLFQINNWINTDPAALPSNAAIVNAYDFLYDRARLCESERDRFPNLIAVDFYREGDLLGVVDQLNAEGPANTDAP